MYPRKKVRKQIVTHTIYFMSFFLKFHYVNKEKVVRVTNGVVLTIQAALLNVFNTFTWHILHAKLNKNGKHSTYQLFLVKWSTFSAEMMILGIKQQLFELINEALTHHTTKINVWSFLGNLSLNQGGGGLGPPGTPTPWICHCTIQYSS